MSYWKSSAIFLSLVFTFAFVSFTFAQTTDTSTDSSATEETGIMQDALPPVNSANELNPSALRRQDTKTFKERRQTLKSTYTDRMQQIEAIKAEKQTKLQELKTMQAEKFADKFQDRLDDTRLKRVENLKQHIILITARYTKVVELLYNFVERVSKHIQERKDSGFDVGDAETKLAAIETSIEATEANIDDLSAKLDDLSNAQSVEEIQAILSDSKTMSDSIRQSLKQIRTDLVGLVRQIR